jgi:hypothetical protein
MKKSDVSLWGVPLTKEEEYAKVRSKDFMYWMHENVVPWNAEWTLFKIYGVEGYLEKPVSFDEVYAIFLKDTGGGQGHQY